MSAEMMQGMIYQGEQGYVWVARTEHSGKAGLLLYFANPDARKLHAVDEQGMKELHRAVVAASDAATQDASLSFCIFHGAYDPLHAGADVTMFAGDPDYSAVKDHLYRGTEVDTLVKLLWPRLRTVSIFQGDRFGGSVEWPLFAQWAVADARARIQFTEVQLGIIPGWNGLLNAVLRTHPANVRYMGQTGNPLTGEQMQKMGLAQTVVATPAPPDRRSVPPEQWPSVWAAHAEVCQRLLLDAALSLATQDAEPRPAKGFRICTDEDLGEEVRRRTDLPRYRALKARFRQDAERIDAQAQPDAMKTLMREITSELNRLGKPLAPRAVAAVSQFVQRWSALPKAELLRRFDEAGHHEADLCDELMHTEHRRTGMNAVLTRVPAERIPLFE